MPRQGERAANSNLDAKTNPYKSRIMEQDREV